jgi:hypothetical protein
MSKKQLKPETEEEAKRRLAYSLNCYVKELDLTRGMLTSWNPDFVRTKHMDPWNITQWKDWEFCQGNYKKIYSIDTNIPRKELYIVNTIIDQINAESDYKKKEKKNQFIIVDKLPIVLEKKEKYNSLMFYIYDKKSTITREYTVQYKELGNDEIKILNGFRSRTVLEDTVLQTGYNVDKYNQLGRNYESYYMSLDKPKYYPFPMNHQTYNFSNVPSNLYMESDKMPEIAGTFKADLFNN